MNSQTLWKTSDNKRKDKGKTKPAALKAARARRSAFFKTLTFKVK